ncbi:MAG: translocation/assembly module TamB domain-containing protein [Steroidobacteraceae bacterium]|nr:translocation/assembly module TamB domain-containing protein [Steroidobacteraceae bacterium]
MCGQFDDPFVTLSSDPPMSNDDALSCLLTGRPSETIKLRHTLNSRGSLDAEAGLEQSADVEYRIER